MKSFTSKDPHFSETIQIIEENVDVNHANTVNVATKQLLENTLVLQKNDSSIEKEISEIKKSVSDGKRVIASAITAQGVGTDPEAAYQDLADHIAEIILGDAIESQVLEGCIFSSKRAGRGACGTIVNRGAVNEKLSSGDTYTVPAGYHDGNGKVKVDSLSSQTPGSASAGDLIAGKTAWVGGNRITGTLAAYTKTGFRFMGATCKFPAACDFKMVAAFFIDHVSYSQFGLYNGAGSKYTLSRYDDWDCPYINANDALGVINLFRSEWTIDVTDYSRMLVTLYGKTTYTGLSREFRGCVGLIKASAEWNTGGEGTEGTIAWAQYSFNSTSGTWLPTIEFDLSNINGEVAFHLSTVHAGYLMINSVTFVPKA